MRSTVSFEDYGTTLHTAFGVMVALYHRAKTGEGQIVDGPPLATGSTFMQAYLAERNVTGIERKSRGNAGFYTAPADAYRARDGWIVVFTVGGDMFARWAKLVGREDLIGDPRFAGDLSRTDHRAIVTGAMKAGLASRTTAEAVAALQAARIPAGPVLDPGQARQLLKYVDYPGAPSPVPLADTAVRLSSAPGGIRRRAPLFGKHTDEILRELRYAEDEIRAMRAAKVV